MQKQIETVTYVEKFHPIAVRYLIPFTSGNWGELFDNIIDDLIFFNTYRGRARPPGILSPLEQMKQGELEESETKRILEEMAFFNSCSPEDKLAYDGDLGI